MPGLIGNTAPKPLELVVRLLLAGIPLAWLAHRFGREATEALLPLIGRALAWLDGHYRILALAVDSQGADTVIRLRVTLARPLLVGGRVILTDARGWAEVTTPVGHLLQPLLILSGVLLAWPARRRREWPARLLLIAPVAAVLLLLNTPFTLWAHLWDLHAHRYEPGRFSPLLAWVRLLDGGGRLLLGMLGAAAVVVLALRFSSRLHITYHRHVPTELP